MSRARDRRKHHERIARWSELQPRLIGSLEDLVEQTGPIPVADWLDRLAAEVRRTNRTDFVLAYPRTGRGA